MANNRVRIVIVGDSGVGKTCLTHLIAHNESLTRPGWTVGCNIQVKIHQFKEGTARQSQYFVELFDIGGSLSHKNTRGVFYSGVHGIILVHDLTNGKSQEQLLDWLHEILNKEGKDTYKSRGSSMPPSPLANYSTDSSFHVRFDLEEFLGATQTPILVMGTKLDLIDEKRQPKTALKKAGGIADKCGAEEIWLNCRDTRSLAAGTTDAVKLSRFFDCVIEKRESIGCSGSHYYGSGSGSGPAGADRRRPPSTATQAAEYSLYGGSSIDAASVMPFLETSDLK
ncbi:rab-like protein 3 [Drosophila persimilis]|uniref:rab-like protein 3 n=1 Tax=Drosophila persimilis TaxID=7234 RepID=UPI000F079E01|nr:rab-like protein 3 [Drosophila persimilis]